jgi:hypothetical protein
MWLVPAPHLPFALSNQVPQTLPSTNTFLWPQQLLRLHTVGQRHQRKSCLGAAMTDDRQQVVDTHPSFLALCVWGDLGTCPIPSLTGSQQGGAHPTLCVGLLLSLFSSLE